MSLLINNPDTTYREMVLSLLRGDLLPRPGSVMPWDNRTHDP